MFRLKIFASLALALILPLLGTPAFAVDTGSADFTRYVSIGDSLTAGFMSGSLNQPSQQNSYPVLIYRQATGLSTGFEQPLVSAPGIPAALELRSLSPLIIAPKPGSGAPLNLNLQRPYNNLAVPGADVHDVVATVTDNGGLHDLILRKLGTQLQQAAFLHPTFTTIWIGNNDVLAAATSGRVIEGVTITPVAQFEADFKTVVATIASTGSKMAIANIPDVSGIPFVNTIATFVVNPVTHQPVPLLGPNGPLGANDRVLLTASSELAKGIGIPAQLGGTGLPLGDQFVLDANEINTINARVVAYNGIIASVANSAGAALVDVNAEFRRLATTGINIGGITFTRNFLTGGIFSYDGVHPTATGYGYIANLFIDAINAKFGGEIPEVNLTPFILGTSTAVFEPSEAAVDGMMVTLTPAAIKNLFWALDVKTKKPHRHGRK
ncbi:MAG TPA: SGNH/GDSL hydrolase family protein [Thermoanaerobaculia bacterium]|jgi:lysophospholipase L1-like esterase|nr:SGNH/GDSL hydrolase family protein [Thermoanaerobaculia bacterium]